MTETPRVWIGCLGCYNAGDLVGEWFDAIDCPTDMDEFNAVPVRSITPEHMTELHEELWVMDHEGFDGFLSGECSPAHAQDLAERLADIPAEHWPALSAFVANEGIELVDAIASFDEAFCGYFESEADYARELADDLGDPSFPVNSWPYTCIDWAHAWNELRLGGDNWSHYCGYEVGYAIFRSI